MSIFLQLIRVLIRRAELKLLCLFSLLHYALFWIMLRLTEESGAKLVEPVNYWYFWATTGLTIGYGDLSPQAMLARLFTPFFQMSGIVLFMLLLGLCVQTLGDYFSKRRRGLMPTTKKEHILVLGDYNSVSTRMVLANAIADWKDDGRTPAVVGCFRNTGDRNPFDRHEDYPDIHPDYVQADGGFSLSVLKQAGADRARQIYVMASDDTTSIGIVSLLSRASATGRIVVLLNQDENHEAFPATALDLQVVRPVQTLLAVREMEDPGTSGAATELLSAGGPTMYSVRPALLSSVSFPKVRELFFEEFPDAVLLGLTRLANGTWTPHLAAVEELQPGDRLIYIAVRDFGPREEQRLNTRLNQ